MKKKVIISGIVLAAVLFIGINLYLTKEKEAQFKEASISISHVPEESVTTLTGNIISGLKLEEIKATYQRKVGPAEEKEYRGIPLSALLQEAGIMQEDITGVAVISRDQYRVELAAETAFAEGNAYVVLYEGKEHLTEEEGPYMLVLCQDELSTRWVKQVVGIEVLEK